MIYFGLRKARKAYVGEKAICVDNYTSKFTDRDQLVRKRLLIVLQLLDSVLKLVELVGHFVQIVSRYRAWDVGIF